MMEEWGTPCLGKKFHRLGSPISCLMFMAFPAFSISNLMPCSSHQWRCDIRNISANELLALFVMGRHNKCYPHPTFNFTEKKPKHMIRWSCGEWILWFHYRMPFVICISFSKKTNLCQFDVYILSGKLQSSRRNHICDNRNTENKLRIGMETTNDERFWFQSLSTLFSSFCACVRTLFIGRTANDNIGACLMRLEYSKCSCRRCRRRHCSKYDKIINQ